jgi:predicted PurR-regulated permease PerM
MKKLNSQKNKKYTQIAVYVILTSVILMTLIWLFLHLQDIGFLLGAGLHRIAMILRPLLGGLVIAFLLYPVVIFFQKKLKKISFFRTHGKIARGLSVLITWLLAFLVIFLVFSILFSAVTSQLHTINFDDISNFIKSITVSVQNFTDSFSSWLSQLNISSQDLNHVLNSISNWGVNFARSLGNRTLDLLSNLPSFLGSLMFSIIFAIYFMLDGDGLKQYWNRVLKAVCNQKIYAGYRELMKDVNWIFSGYIRGELIDAFFMFTVISISLSIVGVPYALLIGLIGGIGNMIPYAGPIFAYLSSVVVNLIHQDLQRLIIGLIVIFILQTIDGNIVQPKLIGSSIHMHPMLVIVSLLVGGAIAGVLGMLIAVPVGALIKTEFERLIDYLAKRKGIPDPAGTEETPDPVPENAGRDLEIEEIEMDPVKAEKNAQKSSQNL